MFMKMMGMFRNVEWSASSESEVDEIKQSINKNAICHIAEDLPRMVNSGNIIYNQKEDGKLKILFMARIVEIKNLDFAIDVLEKVDGEIIFDIAGPIEDENYWNKCVYKLNKLPKNVKWNYKGMIDSPKVIEFMKAYDIFLFPTKSENYGHVIYEAMSADLVPIISDQTIWTEQLNNNCIGKACSLDDCIDFAKTLTEYLMMSRDRYSEEKERVREFIDGYNKSIDISCYKSIFKG